MIKVSPIKVTKKIDRILPEHLYYAVDTQVSPSRYLHLSGVNLTRDKNYAWYGTKRQFRNLCRKFEWDSLNLINRPK